MSTISRQWKALGASVFIALAASGCGGGGGGNPTPAPAPAPAPVPAPEPAPPPPPPSPPPAPTKKSVQAGKVIVGYINGATVWLDINGNHIKDADEPSTISKASGAYQLELSESQRACLPFATLYVDVPVGALDEEAGPVSEAYQMAVAPQLRQNSSDAELFISPLTTAIWNQVRTILLSPYLSFQSCELLRQNPLLRADIARYLKTSTDSLASEYNLSETRIYSDFISAKDTESRALAVELVSGLKASYAYRQKLLKQYPDAEKTFVDVSRISSGATPSDGNGNGNGNGKNWYRTEAVWSPLLFRRERVRLSDDLANAAQVHYLGVLAREAWGSAILSTYREAYRQGGASGYGCLLEESVVQYQDGVRYELSGYYSSQMNEADPMACMSVQQSSPSTPEERVYRIQYSAAQTTFLGSLTLTPGHSEYMALKSWTQLQGKSSQLDFNSVIARIAASGIRFDEEVKVTPFSGWHKRSDDDSGLRVTVEKSDIGPWTRTSTLADGTARKECSADQGKTWGSCGG